MPLPTAAELTDPNATNTQMKQRLGQLAENVESKEDSTEKANIAKSEAITAAATDATTKANAAEANAKADFRKNGFGRLILASSGSIDYNTETQEITFSGTIQVVTNNEITQTLAVPQVLTLTSVSPFRIEYSFDTNTLHAVSYSSNRAANRIVLGSATRSGGSFKAEGFPFTINGSAVYQSHIGELINSVATRINFNNTDKKLIIAAPVRVKSPVYSATVSSSGNVEVAYPSSGTYKLVFNLTTKTLSFSPIAGATPQSVIELATVVFSADAVTSVTGISNYSINGQSAQSTLAQQNFTARLAASNPSAINVSFKNKKISITADKARLAYEKGTLLLPATEIPFLDIPGDYWQKVIFNKESSTFYCKQFNTSLVDNEFVFALIQPYTRSVMGIPDYYLEGQPVKSEPKEAIFISAYGDLKPNYVQPVLPEFETFLATNDKNFNAIYALYDALVSAYPTYVTKKNIGVDSAGNAMYSYQFTTAEVRNILDETKKPKFLIFSGMHGWETAGVMNTYHAMKEICERHAEDTHLEALKHGINFVVVPVCNPSGYALGSRQNINSVDIARNFPSNWIYQPDTQSTTYGGEAPADQIETRNLMAVMDEHKDALCFVSHHNFSATSDFLWVSARSKALISSVKQLIIGQTIHAKKTYAFMPQTDDYYLGYVSYTADGGGMESTHAAWEYDMYAATVEIGRVIPWQPSMPRHSSEFATMACQFFVNYILLAVDNAVKFHNSRVRYYENM